MWKSIKDSLLGLLLPKTCFSCQIEGAYLCQDCQSALQINSVHQNYRIKNLSDLYWAMPYQNHIVKDLIHKFKYEPFAKELGENLASLIIEHLQLAEKSSHFFNFTILPLPLEKKRMKWRGFNQAEELARHISVFLNTPLLADCLVKIKTTPSQINLSDEKRKENLKGAFAIKNEELIEGKKILLIDDIYTTGSTMQEAALVLKKAKAKEIVGMVVARG